MNITQGRFEPGSMLCSSCGKNSRVESLRLDLSKYRIQGDVERVDCNLCESFIAIKAPAEIEITNNFINADGPPDEIGHKICWKEAKSKKERIAYYVLSQIIYPERDPPNPDKYESIYDFADESDLVMIRWERGDPIGFYTLKLKGTKISITNEEYAMHTLDTAYIRSEHRNRGIGTEILVNIVENFPNEDIGFSRPISNGMWKDFMRLKMYVLSVGEVSHHAQGSSIKILGNFERRKRGKSKTDMVWIEKT